MIADEALRLTGSLAIRVIEMEKCSMRNAVGNERLSSRKPDLRSKISGTASIAKRPDKRSFLVVRFSENASRSEESCDAARRAARANRGRRSARARASFGRIHPTEMPISERAGGWIPHRSRPRPARGLIHLVGRVARPTLQWPEEQSKLRASGTPASKPMTANPVRGFIPR